MQSNRLVIAGLMASICAATPAAAADLQYSQGAPAKSPSDWTLSFTTYGWLPWISGDLGIKGRSFDVDVTPSQVIDALDWSGIPAWFSYAELRKGQLSFFNDIVYSKLSGSNDFAATGPAGAVSLAGSLGADYEQTIIELGATYEVWSDRGTTSRTAFDVLAGARYWHQDASVSASAALNGPLDLPIENGFFVARSGSVDWVDPFVGARLRYQLEPGQNLTLRGDVGGFGAGSDFSWQAIATYDVQLCVTDTYAIDGYLGWRALSVDYSEGSGNNRYEFDAVLQGPVIGATVRF
jgi:hypothetical protein